jgi:hypothetical protein
MVLMLALMLVWGGLVAYASEQARGKPRKIPPATVAQPKAAGAFDETESATDLAL